MVVTHKQTTPISPPAPSEVSGVGSKGVETCVGVCVCVYMCACLSVRHTVCIAYLLSIMYCVTFQIL